MKWTKILVVVFLLMALVGGLWLNTQSQENRSRATVAGGVLSLLPSSGNYEVGTRVGVMMVVNVGGTNVLDGFDIKLSFDSTKFKYEGVDMLGGYQLLNDSLANGGGVVSGNTLRVLAVSLVKGGVGSVQVARVWLTGLKSGSTTINLVDGSLLVNQSEAVTVTSTYPATYQLLVPTPTLAPTLTPTKTPTPTLTPTPVPILGNANNDKVVDLLDFGIWKTEYLGLSLTKTADFDGSGTVDLLDFGTWKTEYLY